MGSLTLLQLIVAASASFAGSTVLSAVGFGIGMVAVPILLLVLEPQTTVVMLNTVSIPLLLLIVWQGRSYLNIREMLPIALAGLVGALIGVFVLVTANESVLRISIVALILILTVVTAFNFQGTVPKPWLVGPLAGFLSALMLSALSIGGPLLVLFVLTRNWHRHTIRASMSLYFLFIMTTSVVGYAAGNLFTSERALLIAVAIGPVLLGFWVGSKLAYSMNERVFRIASIAVIIATSLLVLGREVVRL